MNFRRRWGLETVRDLDPRRRRGLGQVSDSAGCIRRKHGYPPDKQESATDTVLAQAEELSDAWMASA